MDLEKLKSEMAERKLNGDEFAMQSACGEYNCPCHYDLPKVIAAYEELEKKHNALIEATAWQNKL